MFVTQEELAKAQVPLYLRDYCAHLYLTMDKCRRKTLWAPWECKMEKMAWEKCQYDDLKRRERVLKKQKAKQALEREAAAGQDLIEA
ncbi:NADH dehydrogenase 1 beta subcomplex subunit 7 ndufb7 [Rhizophlyctis rosea]|nr:NADH dehydrogenase 1 beta subcomplex subunit 7 ndufb7 [Rhizophlyctis rosea]